MGTTYVIRCHMEWALVVLINDTLYQTLSQVVQTLLHLEFDKK